MWARRPYAAGSDALRLPIVAHLLCQLCLNLIRTYLIHPLTDAFHLITRFINVSLSLQMVQAIQVLRFHLLELEKVSTPLFFFIATDKAEYIRHENRFRKYHITQRFDYRSGRSRIEISYRCWGWQAGPVATPRVRILNFENYSDSNAIRCSWVNGSARDVFVFRRLPFGRRPVLLLANGTAGLFAARRQIGQFARSRIN